MYCNIDERILKEGEYFVENKSTVRAAAIIFGVSKSTLHKDLTVKLKYLDDRLYEQVKKRLDENLKERHIRGGNATRKKYFCLKSAHYKSSIKL